MKEIRLLKEKGKTDSVTEKTDGLVAAMKIQKVWRGFATRRKTRRRKIDEMYLIGMVPRPELPNLQLEEENRIAQEEHYRTQDEYKANYVEALDTIKQTISKKKGVAITEQIADEVREWFKEVQATTGKLPEFPNEENGGSRILLSRQGKEAIFIHFSITEIINKFPYFKQLKAKSVDRLRFPQKIPKSVTNPRVQSNRAT